MEEFTNVFKLLSDKTRLRIIWLLSKVRAKLCVCEIVDSLNQNQYNVSRHLRILKNAGLLKEEKEGRWVFYSIKYPINSFQKLIFKTILSIPDELFFLEGERLKRRLKLRKNGKCIVGINSEEWQKISKELEDKLKRR